MKIATKTIDKIKAKGYLFTYLKGTKCFIRKDNGNLFAPGRQIFFDSPTAAFDFEDFCSNYGYDSDSRKAYKTYKAVKREWENIAKLFTEEQLELLREIN